MKVEGVGIERLDTPKQFVEFALKRTRPMLKAWALDGRQSLNELVAAIYLQGVTDGLQTAEYNFAKEAEEKGKEEEKDVEN